jgi:4-oxalomesaconate tautomerase
VADAGESPGVTCMVMRGGTSKGAFFLRGDLPRDEGERDEVLVRLMGTPDPRQIDGIGGAHPLTSKVAVVAPALGPDAEVEYLFLQVGVDAPTVSDRQNCGNLLAAVGQFSVERGLVTVADGMAEVRISMLNTGSVATATFPVADGRPVYSGDTAISGVPGTAAPVRLDFAGIAGGSCGALLPTGNVVDDVVGTRCTLIDNGMPVVVVRADELGVTGYEDCASLENNADLRTRLEKIRVAAGPMMNLGEVTGTTVPKLTLVAPPRDGGHLCTRTFIPHRCHDAIGVLGAVSVATAARIPASVAAEVAVADEGDTVSVEHPTGRFEATVVLSIGSEGKVVVDRAGIIRTARKLIDGLVFPREY